MPTIAGLRRRGYTPEAIRDFTERIGVAKANSTVDYALLEHCIRQDLNERAPRALVVLRPLKIVIDNYPEGQVEWFEIENHPFRPEMGTREVPFSREIYIEQKDFMEEPPRKYYRLSPGREVRLKSAYLVTCTNVVKDEEGNVVEVHCTYDPETRGGEAPDGRKVKGTLHWVSAEHAIEAEVRMYDHLFLEEDPYDVEEGESWLDNVNPSSLEVLTESKLEPTLADLKVGDRYQFMRMGYFCVDPDSTPERPVFNLSVTMRDTWAKIKKRSRKGK
jgi:glutaminyl-tRNA synthetase